MKKEIVPSFTLVRMRSALGSATKFEERKLMKYNATVRRKNGPAATMKILHASDIREAAEIVRAKHGLYTDDPHKGFVINEVRKE